MNPEYRLCTVEERRLLDDVHEAMADLPDPDIDRMMAIVDAERDVIDEAISQTGLAFWAHRRQDAVYRLLNLRAAGGEDDTAAATE